MKQKIRDSLFTLLERLTISSTVDQANTLQGKITSSILLGMALIGVAYTLLFAFTKEVTNLQQDHRFLVTLIATAIISLAYVFSKIGYTKISGATAVITAVLSILGFTVSYQEYNSWYLLYLLFPIILTCILFKPKGATAFTVVILAAALSVYISEWADDFDDILKGPMILLFAASGLALIINNALSGGSISKLLDFDPKESRPKGQSSLINHLVGITNETYQSHDMESLFKTLSREFQGLEFDFMVILIEPGTDIAYIKYNSLNTRLLRMAQRITGHSFGMPRKKIDEYTSVIQPVFQEGKSLFFQDFLGTVKEFIPIPEHISSRALRLLGVNEDTRGGMLPMYVDDQIIGALIIWGYNFQEIDLTPCKVFAGQIASALEKTRLWESELIRTQNLFQANALLKALNSLSAKIITTVEIEDVFTLLGDELKALGFKCMVTLLESDRKTGYFHYTTETQKIKLIENLLGLKIHGRRFPQTDQGGGTLWIYSSNHARYTSDFYDHLVELFPRVPKPLRRQALSLIEIKEDTPAMFLPLKSQEGAVGSLTIWGEDVVEENLSIFKIFASQIANMLEKVRLTQAERERTQDLTHSYDLVNALNEVSVKLTSTTDTDILFEILGRELKKLDYYCMVSKLHPVANESSFEFINTRKETLAKIEKLAGIRMLGYRFPAERWAEPLKLVYLKGQNVFIPNLNEHVLGLFPHIPKIVRERTLDYVGIHENTPAIYVPMVHDKAVIGSIAIWGQNLDRSDMAAFSVFASQLANALENAKLVDIEQEKSRELAHSNSLLNALSEVATNITSVKNPEKIFPILGEKLKQHDYHCAITLINPEYTEAHIHYTNAEHKLIDIIENDLGIKILGKRFTQENMTQKDIVLYEQEKKTFFPSFLDHLYQLFEKVPKPILRQGAKILGILDDTPAVYVPMAHQNTSIGSIMVWGDNLQQEDLAGFSVFASQVANALVNTQLMEKNLGEIETRKKIQKELEISRKELQGIFDHAHDAIIIVDVLQGDIISVNNRACELYGISNGEFTKKNLSSIIDEHYQVDRLITETLENGFCNKFETRYTPAASQTMTFEINSSIVEYEGKASIQCINRDVTAQKDNEEQLKHAALHDSLTGLPNRVLFRQHLENAIARFSRNPDEMFAVIYLDLDNFKRINDSLGHTIGDQFIIEVAARLQDTIRASDIASRFGGDECVILVMDNSSIETAEKFCNRLLTNISKAIFIQGHEIVVSSSIGIVIASSQYKSAEEYLRNADLAMYQSKKAGKNRAVVFKKGMHTGELKKLSLESQMRIGLKNNEFKLVYQPINSLNTRAAVSFEALVRWEHPTDGVISPLKFIPVAEYSGLIHPLGRYILQEACHQFQQWDEAQLVDPEATISINISAVQLMHSDFSNLIQNVLQESKLSPDRLCLEVTESALITNPEDAKKKLQDVREWGVKVHLDDFGTGYSSLSFPTMFPIDAIKIDRQFIAEINDKKNFALVRSMQLLTKALGINLIAEGIETNEQLDKLIELSCEFGQGYYFSEPLGGEEQALFTQFQDIKQELQPY